MSGAGRQTLLLSAQLKNRGHKINVIAPSGALQKKCQRYRIKFHRIKMRSYLNRKADHRIRELIMKIKPDIVHCHGLRGGWLGRLAVRKLPNFTVVYTEYHLTSETSIKNLVWREFIMRGMRFFTKFTDVTIAPSNAIKNFLIKNKLAKNHNIFIIPELIEGKYIRSYTFKKPQGVPQIIGTIGSLTPHKGYIFLLESLQALHKMEIGDSWRCQIVGTGPLERLLKKRIRKMHLSKYVNLLGKSENLIETMRHFSCYVQSSISEPYGSITSRALALGIPVVVTRKGGLPDIVQNGVNGMVVPYGKQIIMAQAVKEILENEKKRNEMGFAAKQYAKNVLSPKLITDRIEQIYDKALKIRKFKNM